MKQGGAVFHIAGEGSWGLKVEDLISTADIWESSRCAVIGGAIVANSYFHAWAELNNLDKEASAPHDAQLDELAHKTRFPTELIEANEAILNAYPGQVLAIRSSAPGERGGTGIFTTSFYVPKGCLEEDAYLMALEEAKVYRSAYEPAAQAFYAKHSCEKGMALFVTPVAGQWLGDYFMPMVSGSGYSSYEDSWLVRIVPGLGSRAVNGDGLVFRAEHIESYGYGIAERLKRWTHVDAINRQGRVETIPMPKELSDKISFVMFGSLIRALNHLRAKNEQLYFEWAHNPASLRDTVIVQSAPYLEAPRDEPEILCPEGRLIARANDIVNYGRKECTRIVLVEPYTWDTVKRELARFNSDNCNYLLIVPPDATSVRVNLGTGKTESLSFEHFSNASAIYEYNYGEPGRPTPPQLRGKGFGPNTVCHREFMAGLHFQQICTREDILFMSALYPDLRFEQATRSPSGLFIYDRPALVINHRGMGEGRIYLTP